jgi:glycosyltransferase involved in cell wall biosynthesis
MIRNSIIMTVFNREPRVLWNTLHALRKNDLTNCEILIVDDGSTVDYQEQKVYCESYGMPAKWFRIEADEYPEWTYTIPHPDGGVINNPALAMNRAIQEAEGSRLMFLSSDCMLPDFAVKEAKKCGDHYWLANVVDQASNIMYVCDRRAVPFHFFSACKKAHVEAIGGFDENYLRGIAWEDSDFGSRLGLYCRHAMFDSSVLVVHQSHPPLAYGDSMKGMKISEEYTRQKWGGVPWNINDTPEDPIEHVGTHDGHVYRVNPRIKDGRIDPLCGLRR